MFGPIELAQNDFLIVLDFTLLMLFARYVWYRVFVDGIYEGFGAWEVFSRPATKIGWALMLTYASRWLDRLSFCCAAQAASRAAARTTMIRMMRSLM